MFCWDQAADGGSCQCQLKILINHLGDVRSCECAVVGLPGSLLGLPWFWWLSNGLWSNGSVWPWSLPLLVVLVGLHFKSGDVDRDNDVDVGDGSGHFSFLFEHHVVCVSVGEDGKEDQKCEHGSLVFRVKGYMELLSLG